MHSGWAVSVCLVNAQNAGMLPVHAELGIAPSAGDKLAPFVLVTGVTAGLSVAGFLLSVGAEPAQAREAAVGKAPMKGKRA
mmetsp:Transcript_10221/g.26433  ORF Transcript_10221/g.26433 Transcript_10221/m.26433 type:complete len:81 (-) Transcript_10221:13-255(-)